VKSSEAVVADRDVGYFLEGVRISGGAWGAQPASPGGWHESGCKATFLRNEEFPQMKEKTSGEVAGVQSN